MNQSTKATSPQVLHVGILAAAEAHGMVLAIHASRRRQLEARVGALEARAPGVPWAGVWAADKSVKAGTFVTHEGGLWYAHIDSKGVRPGTGDGVFELAVKRGANGKDAR